MHFLITNDDGIQADGIATLEKAALATGGRVTVVAPKTEQSMCGHRVTTYSSLQVEELSENHYTVDGTPADCVRIALFAMGLRPDFVLSGINHGGNLGQDIVISGTVAAAREATYHGLRAAAFSHYIIGGIDFDWNRIAGWTSQILADLQTEQVSDGEFWNVNFPHLPPGPLTLPKAGLTRPARSPLNVTFSKELSGVNGSRWKYAARYHERPQDEGSDVAVCFGGGVSVSKLSL